MTTPSANPLLQTSELPLFDQIKPEHVNSAVDELLKLASNALDQVSQKDFPSDWHAWILALHTLWLYEDAGKHWVRP